MFKLKIPASLWRHMKNKMFKPKESEKYQKEKENDFLKT